MPSNVAEGFCRRSTKAYLHHVAIALGSQAEIETCLEICRRLDLIGQSDFQAISNLAAETGRLLSGLHAALKEKIRRGRSPRPQPAVLSPQPLSP